jgi:putative ABC transport system ATP-binding protein
MIPPGMRFILKDFLVKHKSLVGVTLLSSVFTYVVESVFIPRILGNAFTDVSDIKKLKQNLILLVVSWSVSQIGSASSDWCNHRIEPVLTHHVSQIMFNQIFTLFENEHKTENVSKITELIELIQRTTSSIMYRVMFNLLPRLITISLIMFNIYVIHPPLGKYVISLLLVFFISILVWNLSKKNVLYSTLNARDDYLNKVTDVFMNMEFIHSTPGAMDKERDQCIHLTDLHEEHEWISQQSIIKKQTFSYLCNIIIFVILLYLIFRMYQKKEIDGRKVTTLILAVSPLFTNMADILYYIPEFNKLLSILNFHEPFINSLLSHIPKDGQSPTLENGDISFENVTFSYGGTTLFSNYSINIPRGSFVTLRGPSGSGKTTFLKLLFRVLKPNEGHIKVADFPLKELSSMCLKQHMVYLHQHSTLLHDTLYHNMTYGLVNSPELRTKVEDIFKTYKLQTIFQADDFKFLDNSVGKGGELLSGGQRQVIHLIRCFLNTSAKILILDEPTSALDRHHKTIIGKLLQDIHKQGKTILLITHDDTIISPHVLKFQYPDNPVLEKI